VIDPAKDVDGLTHLQPIAENHRLLAQLRHCTLVNLGDGHAVIGDLATTRLRNNALPQLFAQQATTNQQRRLDVLRSQPAPAHTHRIDIRQRIADHPTELGAQRVGDKLQHRTTLRPRPQRHDIHVQHRLLPLREQR
jgi:hypothetical protein